MIFNLENGLQGYFIANFAGTRLDKAAGRRGLRVLYPAQGTFDNPARCWNWFAPRQGETAAILALVRETLRGHDEDGARRRPQRNDPRSQRNSAGGS